MTVENFKVLQHESAIEKLSKDVRCIKEDIAVLRREKISINEKLDWIINRLKNDQKEIGNVKTLSVSLYNKIRNTEKSRKQKIRFILLAWPYVLTTLIFVFLLGDKINALKLATWLHDLIRIF
jgi:hypothetical protein